jgi:hypothetical protein
MTKYYWTAFCKRNRYIAIDHIVQIINTHGAVTDSKMFSDLSLSLIIEIEARQIAPLYAELGAYIDLSDTEVVKTDATVERMILLSVNFTRGKGNLKIEVPAVPG